MPQVIDARACSFTSVRKTAYWWNHVCQRVAKVVIHITEYYVCCVNDPCLRRRYYICPVTGRVVSAK